MNRAIFTLKHTLIFFSLALCLHLPMHSQSLENLGANVNSQYKELAPLISPDGTTLYYTRVGDPRGRGSGDIWVSHILPDGNWGKAKPLTSTLNNTWWNSVCGVTADNSLLLVKGDYTSQGYHLSTSTKTASGWSTPEPVKFERKLYHKEGSSFAHLSADGQTMIVEIYGRDTYGSNDLYVSFKKENGVWTYPKNLGNVVNTPKKEITPFLAPDNKTLYYSTERPGGQGGWDIFVTKRVDDSWTNWTKPKNLGPKVNTPGWDAYYKIDSKGEYGYLVSNYKSYGQGDVQRIKLPENAKPDPVLLLKGKVRDKKTGDLVAAKVIIKDLSTGKVLSQSISSLEKQDYQVVLTNRVDVALYAEADGYYAVRDTVHLTELAAYGETSRDVFLEALEVDKPIRLSNVFFVQSKSVLLPGSFDELNELVQLMNDNPHFNIVVEGHTDNMGDPGLNQQLSEQRAKKVMAYLIKKGIEKDRIQAKGYGQERPLNDNSTQALRQENRRVEFRIVN